MVVHLSCVAQYEETSFHATDNDCVALKVWVAGPGSVESWRAAVRSQIKVANLGREGGRERKREGRYK